LSYRFVKKSHIEKIHGSNSSIYGWSPKGLKLWVNGVILWDVGLLFAGVLHLLLVAIIIIHLVLKLLILLGIIVIISHVHTTIVWVWFHHWSLVLDWLDLILMLVMIVMIYMRGFNSTDLLFIFLLVKFWLIVIFVVNLFKNWKSWLLWGTASITWFKICPEAISICLATNLLISSLSKPSSFFKGLK